MAVDPSTIIAQQQAYAATTIEASRGILQSLAEMALPTIFTGGPKPVEIPDPGFEFDTSAELQDRLIGLFPAGLSVDEITAQKPEFSPVTVDELETVVVPDFNKAAPILEMPSVPNSALPSAPTAPFITDPVLPSAPVLSMPSAPVLGGITIPEPPSVEIPVFTFSAPVDDLVTPTNNFSFFEEAYSSALLDELQVKLMNDLQSGGYGIEPLDEAMLFNRERDRETEAMLQRIDNAGRAMAMRGFPLPTGELSIHFDRAVQDMQNKLSSVSRDIALKRADLYVDNRKFTIEQTKGLEQILIGYHNSVMERALNAAKAVLDAAVKIFDAQVSRFNARLDAYKTEATVFEARVRAALTQVEIFKAQMEGKRLEVDVQRTQVEVYNAQLAGVNAVINLYKTQMEAAQVQAGVERLRIESFRALIEAYTSQVQAKVAEFNMFESGVKGQVARMQAFESEVNAHTAVVGGVRAKADILIARLKGQIDIAGQNIETYKTRADEYKTDIAGQTATINAKTQVYGAQVQGASAQSSALADGIRLDISAKDLEMKRNIAQATIAVEYAKLLLQEIVATADMRVKAGVAGAQFYQALAGGAVNSINTLAASVASSQV